MLPAHQSLKSFPIALLYTVLLTLVLTALLSMFNKAFAEGKRLIDARLKKGELRSLRLWTVEIVPARRLPGFGMGMVKTIWQIAIIVTVYFYLSLVFSLFPWTQGWTP